MGLTALEIVFETGFFFVLLSFFSRPSPIAFNSLIDFRAVLSLQGLSTEVATNRREREREHERKEERSEGRERGR